MSARSENLPTAEEYELGQVVARLAHYATPPYMAEAIATDMVHISEHLAVQVGWEGDGVYLRDEPKTLDRFAQRYDVLDVSPPSGILSDQAYGRMILAVVRPDAMVMDQQIVYEHQLAHMWRPDVSTDTQVTATIRISPHALPVTQRTEESRGLASDSEVYAAMAEVVILDSERYAAAWHLQELFVQLARQEMAVGSLVGDRFERLTDLQTKALTGYLNAILHEEDRKATSRG